MKIEVKAARADRHGVKLRDRLVAALPRLAPLASRFPALANLRNQTEIAMQPTKISCQHVWKVFGATPAHIASTVTPARNVSVQPTSTSRLTTMENGTPLRPNATT